MAAMRRKRIGLFFLAGENWLGGVYYIQNIIKALNLLEEERQPVIILFCNQQSIAYAANIKYKHLEKVGFQLKAGRMVTYMKSILLNKNLFVSNIISKHKLDGLFPLYDYIGKIENGDKCKIVSWYPDLQHKIFPEYFMLFGRVLRNFRIDRMLKHATDLIVSSQATLNDFNTFYRLPKKLKVQILNFTVVNNDIQLTDYDFLKPKYAIAKDYFIVSNQFYEHKNHWVLFKAVKLLKDKGITPLIFLTGKLEDYKKPGYIESLLAYIKNNELEESLKLLGIIPREEQLSLMKNSLALIQPSRFEGWNTSIEDAKSLGVQVICSNIDVHNEQLEDKGYYFEVDSEAQLANLIEMTMEKKYQNKPLFSDYNNRIYNFGNSFLNLFN